MTRDIEELYPKVLQYAPNCPEPLMLEHLREAAIELCRSTRCWRTMDEFEVTGPVNTVPSILPYSALFQIEKAWFNDYELEPKSFSGDMLMHDEGMPRYISQAGPDSILIDPAGKGTIKMTMFLMPSQNAQELPEFLFEQFPAALAAGALGSIMLLPNQPFTSPQMAGVFAGQFQQVLDRNFAFNLRGQQRAKIRTRASFL